MSIQKGTTSIRRFFLSGRLPHASKPFWVSSLKSGSFVAKQLKAGESNSGWAVFGNELSTDFDASNMIVGKYVVFSLRQDTLSIPRATFKLHLDAVVAERKKVITKVSHKDMAEMRAEVMEMLEETTEPRTTITQVVVDTIERSAMVDSTSSTVQEHLMQAFFDGFGLRMRQADFSEIYNEIGNYLPGSAIRGVEEDPSGEIYSSAPSDDDEIESPASVLGGAFLTWLLCYQGREPDSLPFSCSDEIQLTGNDGARQTIMRRGTPASCPELQRALKLGKQVSRMKLYLVDVDIEEAFWTLTIDRAWADMRSVKPPKLTEADYALRLLERLNNLARPFEMLDKLLLEYLKLRYSKAWPSVRKGCMRWVEEIAD